MIPSRLLVLAMVIPLLVGFATLVEPDLLLAMLALDGLLVVLAGLDAVLALPRYISIRRQSRDVFSIGQPNLVTLYVRSRARRRMRIQISDDVFSPSEIPDLPVRARVPRRSQVRVTYRVTPQRRGAYVLGDHHVRHLSPLGLWVRQYRLPARSTIRVYPNIQQVRNFELRARQDRDGGSRATRKRGGRSEFEALREYQRDDEFRSIDWKATARRHKLIARQYQLERDQSIVFLLDAGRLMTAEVDGLPLFDHALNAALMLATVAARGGDHVGLMAFADRVLCYLPPKAGRSAARTMVQATFNIHPQLLQTEYERAFGQLGPRLRKRSLVIIATQVVDEVSAAQLARYTRALLPRHLPLVVLFRDGDVENMALGLAAELPGRLDRLQAPYTAAAAAELLGRRDRLVRELRRAGALVLDVPTGQLTGHLVNRYLEVKARQLL